MITLPGTPFAIQQISKSLSTVQPHYVPEILAKRLAISTTNNNTPLFISTLEDYLNLIYSIIVKVEEIEYSQTIVFAQKIFISDSIPWSLPFTSGGRQRGVRWRLSDEIVIVLENLVFAYILRSSEIVSKILNENGDDSLTDEQSQQLWISCFKFYKKSKEYLNFLKQSELQDDIYETSSKFVRLLDCLISTCIQLTFLSKSIWTLRNLDYDISTKNNLNYSTLSRISIFVRDELKMMINTLRSHAIDSESWVTFLESLSKLNNAYIGVLLSIENYQQDHIGKSIGFINFSLENITKKTSVDESLNDAFDSDSKLKKKLLNFKHKLGHSNGDKALKHKTNLKINSKIYENLVNDTLKMSMSSLFELVKVLNLKYNLENNNLKFDQVASSTELLQSHLPTGRSVPLSDSNISWVPEAFSRSNVGSATVKQDQHVYY